MALNEKIMAGISRKTGLTPEQLKKISPEKIKEHLTKRTGKKFKVTSLFPVIGRGNILREGIKTSAEINKETDRLLGV